MKDDPAAGRPRTKIRRSVARRTSDLEFDHGAPLLPSHRTLCDRWRTQHVEEEHGLRADVYQALGLM